MVLQDCKECTTYWLRNGCYIYGYRLLSRDQHIPEAHVEVTMSVDGRASCQPVDDDDGNCSPRSFLRAAYLSSSSKTNYCRNDKASCSPARVPQPKCGITINCPEINDRDAEADCSSHPVPLSASCASELNKRYDVEDEGSHDRDEYFCYSYNESEEGCCPKDKNGMQNLGMDAAWCSSLYIAAIVGDWKTAEKIRGTHGTNALRARIRGNTETVLHIAVGSGHGTIFFIRELLKYLSNQDVKIRNCDGCTPLGIAAKVGYVEAAKLLVSKHQELLYIPDINGSFPIHNAAEYGHKKMLRYLIRVTKRGKNPDPYDPEKLGPELLRLIIKAEFYDVALGLLEKMPELATCGIDSYKGLLILAENPLAFSCWKNEGVLQSIIYACVPKPQKKKSYKRNTGKHEVENAAKENSSAKSDFSVKCQGYLVSVPHKMHHIIWTIFEKIVPLLNHMKHEMLKGHHAKKLVKRLCREAANNLERTSEDVLLFKLPLLTAADNGIHEIVKEIIYSFPDAICYTGDNNSEVFRLAIKNRHQEVYNLLHEMSDLCVNIIRQSVENKDNILHLAGYLAPSDRLRVVSGAALQMQRELQWFKEIESQVQPVYRNKRNEKGKTPQEVFSESHQNLMEEGERWMRDTANSCTVAATLIATIVFAAAITVPGGNNGENGKAIFGSEKAFIIFGVADSLSLFTACVSILMFLSILTSRYAEGDFLRALPTRLIIGLLTLFVSVASMMAAFSSTIYLMFGDQRRWILGCVIWPSCLIVAIFAYMQFSLLVDMINSTYRCAIFKRRCETRSLRSIAEKCGFFKKAG